MTLSIDISPELEAVLSARAKAAGLTAEAYLQQLVQRELGGTAPQRHISDIVSEIMSDVPREMFEQLPLDGASEHDHYLYGSPKSGQ